MKICQKKFLIKICKKKRLKSENFLKETNEKFVTKKLQKWENLYKKTENERNKENKCEK